jgi:hypothetical protein
MTGGASAPLARPIPPTRNQKCSKSGGEKARSLPCASAPPPQFNLFNESPHEYDGLTARVGHFCLCFTLSLVFYS